MFMQPLLNMLICRVQFVKEISFSCVMHNKVKHARMESPFQYHCGSRATRPAVPKDLFMHFNIQRKIISTEIAQRAVNIKHSMFKPESGVQFTEKTIYFHPGNARSFLRSVLFQTTIFFLTLMCRFGAQT